MRSENAPLIRLEDYAPAPYGIDTVDLDIRLAPLNSEITAKIHFVPAEGTVAGTPLVLDGDDLQLTSLKLNGATLPEDAYSVTSERLELKAPPATDFTLEIGTKVAPKENTELSGLYQSSGTYCTQCEAEGFRRITYFLDRPDVLAVYTTRIEAEKAEAPILLGNGNPVESGDVADTPSRHYAIWHDPHPKPSYLFAMVGGDLAHLADTFTTMSGRTVDLKIYVEHGNETQCDWAMDSLKRSMKWDEDVFGREYDLDVFNIVAVSDFNMGAMENKGLNVFNDKYVLADPDTATDQDYANIEAVIAHEYFHNWTGNRITCRDWFQLCLKEGLTVFRDQEFSSDMRSRPVKRISDVRLLKSHQFPEDSGPLAHPVRPRQYKEINNFYTATVYEKGAEVVRMLKTLIGPESFRKGMDLYFDRHDGEATTIEAFLACFSEAAAMDLDQFSLWYEQAGTPLVKVDSTYDEKAGVLSLTFHQSIPPLPGQPRAEPAVIPLRFGLIGPNGQDLDDFTVEGAEVREDCLILSEREQTVRFSGLSNRPVVSLLRSFSAPIRLDYKETSEDLLLRARHDSDPFNRWQASQTLATNELLRLTDLARKSASLDVDPATVAAFGEILADSDLDPAFKALALQLPGETDLAREIGKDVDPDAIHLARHALRSAIGSAHAEAFLDVATRRDTGTFDPSAGPAGERALANQALAYYVASDRPGHNDLLSDFYRKANNMTDRLAALNLLVHDGFAFAAQALEDFRERHAKSSLALDKWFMVQATDASEGAFERIEALTTHRLFDTSNPNRVRSLIHAFASGNPVNFARPDGKGFDFVADYVLKIDARNPQVAARLLTSFRSWRAYESGRSSLAEASLRRIENAEKLSRDSREIAERCLQ